MYHTFSKTYLETANENIPLKPKLNKRVPWENNTISEKLNTLSKGILFKRRSPYTYNVEMYNTARKHLVNTYNSEQVIYLQRQIDNIQSAAYTNKSAIAWYIVNKISGRKSVNKAKLQANSQVDRIHGKTIYMLENCK